MDRFETQSVIRHLTALWPDWKPTDDELALWGRNLLPFSQDAAGLAIDQYKTTKSGSFNKPKLHDVLEACRNYQAKMHGSSDKNGSEPAEQFRIMCLDTGEKQGFWCTKNKLIADDAAILRAAERQCEAAAGIYGGRWVPKRTSELEQAPF